MTEMEKRVYHAREELRLIEEEGKPTRVVGLAVPYNQLSDDMNGLREQIAPGAFTEALSSGRDLRADVEHDRRHLLARTKNGTLKFEDRADGLYIDLTLPDTTLGRDTAAEIRSQTRDALSVSWEFEGVEDRFASDSDNQIVRTVTKAPLTGVALTAWPAYPQTAGTLAMRSLDAFLAEQTARDKDLLRRRLDLAEAED
jgi:hypothetical protein